MSNTEKAITAVKAFLKEAYNKRNIQVAMLSFAIAFALIVFSNSITEISAPTSDNIDYTQSVFYKTPVEDEEEDDEEEQEAIKVEFIDLSN